MQPHQGGFRPRRPELGIPDKAFGAPLPGARNPPQTHGGGS